MTAQVGGRRAGGARADDGDGWWGQLRHGGMLVAPALLPEFFPDLAELDAQRYGSLRDEWLRFDTAMAGSRQDGRERAEHRRRFIAAVLEAFLGLHGMFQKGPSVQPEYRASSPTLGRLFPDWLLLRADRAGAAMAVMIDVDNERVGAGRGRRAHARLVELLRRTGVPLGLLTNARQFRLVHAGPDFDAWAEWDASAWFDEGDGRLQLAGLRTVLGRESLLVDGTPVLTRAVQESRHRQGDLAQVLGEQVRQAIERLLTPLDTALAGDPTLLDQVREDPDTGQRLDDTALLRALYQAATRVVMRLVVLLYAEARDLLPTSLDIYHDSYSVEGLYRDLNNAWRDAGHGGDHELAERHSAWPRLLALCDTVHAGSAHEALPLRPYGGTLFQPGDAGSHDPVLRALAALEGVPGSQYQGPDDRTVYEVVRRLKVGRIRVRSGRAATWVAAPVDFSDLRTEYIGIIYEGLLDYELRRTSGDDPVIFLDLGRQPALPLSRLESLSNADLKNLVDKLRKDKGGLALGTDDEEDTEDTEESDTEEKEEGRESVEGGGTAPTVPKDGEAIAADDDESAEGSDLDQRAQAWAERTAEAAGLVRRPRGKRADLVGYEKLRAAAGRGLIARVVPGGGLYLVAGGGLRKGTGTFYTRPALAVPLVQRTLEPLCYEGEGDQRRPRTPEEILELKVCDPAMGSGSFPVAALRYLTQALAESITVHGRLTERGDQTAITLPFGQEATGQPHEELLPARPDDDRFEALLTARLARHVVERCIYGVDLNPMAVELARLALWVETLDKELPFEFLDHKLKVGNALVGCWLHLVEDYPARAWEREGGDGLQGKRTKWLKETYNGRVKPELERWIRMLGGQLNMFAEQPSDPTVLVARVRKRFTAIHDLPAEQREAAYRELQDSTEYQLVKRGMDRWCAVWFWPPGTEPALTPAQWQDPAPEIDDTVDNLAARWHFFHWELEFPDVFTNGHAGFDAVLGNPPWEVERPKSEEFFSVHDPLYRTYGKQVALAVQRQLFAGDPSIEEEWVTYQARFRSLRTWVDAVANPFDITIARGNVGRALRGQWEQLRKPSERTARAPHPFRYQGTADLNTYKMFLEAAHHVLHRRGRIGMVIPSGIWTDLGLTTLRRLFLEECRWEWCYGFENRDPDGRSKTFPIHPNYQFAPVVLEKSGDTSFIRVAFGRRDVTEWVARYPIYLSLSVADIRRFSPKALSFLQVASSLDLEISGRVYAHHPLLDEVLNRVGAVSFREFHATGDSHLFATVDQLRRSGHLAPNVDSRDPRVRASMKIRGFLPLYAGDSLWFHNPYFQGVDSFIRVDDVDRLRDKSWLIPRFSYRSVGRSVDQRTFIVGLMPPTVHKHSLLAIDNYDDRCSMLAAICGSLLIDYIVRMKVAANISWFYLETLPIAQDSSDGAFTRLAPSLVWRLNALGADFGEPAEDLIVDPAERMAARLLLDALVAGLYELEPADVAHIATRFPIYDRKDTATRATIPEEFRYPNLAVRVFEAYYFDGVEAAEAEAARLMEARRAAGLGFGLDEVYVPPGGWERANREAKEILEGG